MKQFILLLTLISLPLVNIQAAEEPIGRLFSTPEQRNNLDALRELKRNQPEQAVETVVHATVIERKPIVLPDAINMQGYVKRTDGKKGTVWINGKTVQEHSGNQDVQVGKLPKNGKRVPMAKRLSLKAGQIYDPETNKVRKSRSYRIQLDSAITAYTLKTITDSGVTNERDKKTTKVLVEAKNALLGSVVGRLV
ncbi:hypothetical protein GQR58_028919 [Nymphon striatum]|nr:hypothetical protein GQR58_028919 [Nymphon striatum]